MFLVVTVYGFVTNFSELEPWHLAIFGGITVLSMAIDYFSGIIGAKWGGASRKAIIFGLIGLLIGLVLFPPLGAFIGMFLGVFVAELIQFNDHLKALRAASYSLVGIVAGAIANFVLAIGFFVDFLVVIL